MNVIIVQLPFPSTLEPHPALADYYRDYSRRFSEAVPEYFVPKNALWEMPLWVAYLGGMLRALHHTATFVDLSHEPPFVDNCVERLLASSSPGALLMLSPLAQNFDLAVSISRRLLHEQRRTMIGGNMALLADADDASFVYRGLLDLDGLRRALDEVLTGHGLMQIQAPVRGRVSWVSDHAILAHYHGRVPLLRLNASHGCLYACNFCGDAWSRKLHVVEPAVLEEELQQFERLFPETKLIYIGDKTFGQSREAVANLLAVFQDRSDYRLIVQTHIHTISPALIETMARLHVAVVEMGFESADPAMLRQLGKVSAALDRHDHIFELLDRHGIHVVLNVLGGLPLETSESHAQTIGAITRWRDVVWLYNLYNFVPYPLTPAFPQLRPRIFNWNFADWREDAPVVFTPYFLSVEQSWAHFLEKVETAHAAIRPSAAVQDDAATSRTHAVASAAAAAEWLTAGMSTR